MIQIQNLNKQFGKSCVLDNVSVQLNLNHCIGLIGPNACGKTTMIKSILGMVLPTKGKIFFNGQSISGDVTYKNNIGYMPQIGKYPENMTILQVVNMIKNIRGTTYGLDEELWYAFGLHKISDKKMGTLSGGTTQKVSATLAFLFNPEVLILDEPTAGLDPVASEILRSKIINEKQKGKLIIITSHLLSELDELLTHIIFMQDGKIIFYKTIDELYTLTGQSRISKAVGKLLNAKAQ